MKLNKDTARQILSKDYEVYCCVIMRKSGEDVDKAFYIDLPVRVARDEAKRMLGRGKKQ